jgi:hypothetical protein
MNHAPKAADRISKNSGMPLAVDPLFHFYLFKGILAACAIGLGCALLSSCTHTDQTQQRYISPSIEGVASRINLTAVEQAFVATRGRDPNAWMSAFEQRVNQIYEEPTQLH